MAGTNSGRYGSWRKNWPNRSHSDWPRKGCLVLCLLGEGLNLGEARDAAFTFTLSGIIAWVGKQAQISAKPISLAYGRQLIAQAIAKGHIRPRGPGFPQSIPCASTPFNFCNQDIISMTCQPPGKSQMMGGAQLGALSRTVGARPCATMRLEPRSETVGVMTGTHPSGPCSHQTMDLRGDKNTASTSSSMSLMSERSGGSRHPQSWPDIPTGNQESIWRSTCQLFKDEDTKDAVTYQSWHWDLTMYCQAMVVQIALSSLMSSTHYKVIWGSIVRSLGMDITLDDILNILDEHYHNMWKTWMCLIKELFQMHIGAKRKPCWSGDCVYRDTCRFSWHHSQNTSPPDQVPELKCDHFYSADSPNGSRPWRLT